MPTLAAIVLLAIAGSPDPSLSIRPPSTEEVGKRLSRRLDFVENKGQWHPSARFMAKSPGLNLWVTTSGVVYDFYRTERPSPQQIRHVPPHLQPTPTRQGHVVRVEFEGASSGALARGEDRQPGYRHFLKGDQSSDSTYVRQYGSSRVSGLYPGIDLVTYQDDQTGGPRYDIVLRPGADLAKVKMRYEGAQRLRVLPNGQVAYDTALGTVTERGLQAYQIDDTGTRQQVSVAPRVSNGSLTYNVPDYDRSKTLIIDPLVYSSFLGGSFEDDIYGITVDATGSVYVTGYTVSDDFPSTTGAYDRTYNDFTDVFVTKFNPGGSNVVYSTFIGGSATDRAFGIAVDADGSAYVVGYTTSNDFPLKNAFDNTLNGYDGFLTKLNAAGSALAYSTYFGGTSYEFPMSIAVDDKKRATVVGYTHSTDYPILGAVQSEIKGSPDGFVTRFTPNGGALVFSTYLGGSSSEVVYDVAVDSLYRTIIIGYTGSTDYPMKNALDATQSGSYDVFVSKLAPNGGSLVFSTYYGGSSTDYGYGVTTDANDAIYLAGVTYSSDITFTTKFGPNNINGGYLVKLPPSGASITYADHFYFGYINDVSVDDKGRAMVGGYAYQGFPTTPGSYQPTWAGGGYDGFIAQVSGNGSTLLYSTFIGGSQDEYTYDFVADAQGNGYLAGYTNSYDYPAKFGGFDIVYLPGDIRQLFVSKISPNAQGLTIGPIEPVIGGNLFSGTVYLPEPAPAAGTDVFFSGGGGALVLPAGFTIPQGQSQGSFQGTAKGVDFDRVVSLNANTASSNGARRMLILPAGPDRVPFNPASVVGGDTTTVTGRVVLNGKAGPSGLLVKLTPRFLPSSLAKAEIPDTVMVPPDATQATFPVTHMATTEDVIMTVTASANGKSATGKLTIKKP